MNWVELVKTLIMGAVEGITEFLPVSSTGHLIITGDIIHFTGAMADTFEIVIQLGAILAVCWLYREKLLNVTRTLGSDRKSQSFVVNLFVAFVPAAVVGLALHKIITELLFNPITVAIALIVGGVAILIVERVHVVPKVTDVDQLGWRDALKVGCVQTLALFPGVSRSGATIMGGLVFGLSRQTATEFSFFLAIPTMFAATLYELAKHLDQFHAADVEVFAVGFVMSFLSALVAVKGFIRYVSHHDFAVFAWYRIIFGAIVLWYFWPGA